MTPLRTILLAVWIVLLASARVADASAFRFATVDLPGASLTALRDVDSHGSVVGFYEHAGSTHGFLLAAGQGLVTIDFPGADATFAGGLDDSGTIVGEYVVGGASHAFLLAAAYTGIDLPGSDETFGTRINGRGDLSGTYRIGSETRGFTRVAGTFSTVDVPGADATLVQSINDRGETVGFFYGTGTRGFLQSGTTFTAFEVPGADETFPTDLDNLGGIVGYHETGGRFRGFLRRAGSFEPIDFPGADHTFPQGMNDHGLVVGFYDLGGIVHGFVASSVAEPASPAGLLVGIAMLACMGRRPRPCRVAPAAELRPGRGTKRPRRALACLVLLGASSAVVEAQTPSLQFVHPVNGQVAAPDNLLLWAVVVGDPASLLPAPKVVFEASADGTTFVPLPQGNAPDFGLGSYTSSVDVGEFPVGTLFLRARVEGDSVGPVVHIDVRRRPVPDCHVARLNALRVRFDCSATRNDNGGIASYEFDFGDGTRTVTQVPHAVHAYRRFGKYPVAVTVRDRLDLAATIFRELVLVQLATLQNPPRCGCEELTVNTRGMSQLRDTRRPRRPPQSGYEPAPLGRDPDFATFNFEVSAALTAMSDPGLCTEGQRVRRTVTSTVMGQQRQDHKRACTRGLDLHICAGDRDCDTRRTCNGGALDKQACDSPAQRQACVIGGGTCEGSSMDGRCTEFPLAGRERGNDDYRRPFPEDNGGVKLHVAATRTPVWIDFPGASVPHRQLTHSFRYEADFIAFVEGRRNCSCHFQVIVDWDATNRTFRDATGLRAAEGETSNCRIVVP